MHIGFEAQKSRVEKNLKTICVNTHVFSNSKIQSWRELKNHMHMGFQAKKSKIKTNLKIICANAHGFSSLEIQCIWFSSFFKLWFPSLKTICANTHVFSSSKIQSWIKLENHMFQHTWVFKLRNQSWKKTWKPYVSVHTFKIYPILFVLDSYFEHYINKGCGHPITH
jgi:hypothetical protein